MPDLQTLLVTYGLALVFGSVLLEQAGLPVPAYPLLVTAGALCMQGVLFWPALLAACALACLLADSGWYWAGRRYGTRLLGTICRVSLSPDACVRQTQQRFLATGPRMLLVAKFLPGASALATVMAGQSHTGLRRFWGYDLAGSLLWAGSALALGAVFAPQVVQVLALLARWGGIGLAAVAVALVGYIGWRWLQRRRLRLRLRGVPRLPAAEWQRWHQEGREMVVIDVRPAADARLPGAHVFDTRQAVGALALDPATGHDIVIYCACPHEISAALLAERLREAGFSRVWALEGGFEAVAALAAQPPTTPAPVVAIVATE